MNGFLPAQVKLRVELNPTATARLLLQNGLDINLPPSHTMRTPQPSPKWCVCGYCREMTTEAERVCCKRRQDCVSQSEAVRDCCLNVSVLRTAANRVAHFIFEVGGEHTQDAYRHLAYTQFTHLSHGYLGKGVRIPCPSCVVWLIRERFPSADGVYTGFKNSR